MNDVSLAFLYRIDLPSDIPYDLDSVELHSVIATVSYLRGRALMGSVECRTAEALDYFER